MNFKRILSTALTVVMIFMTIVGLIPMKASAAYSPESTGDTGELLDLESIKEYINNGYLKYNFSTAQEMLDYELSLGGTNEDGEEIASYILSVTSNDGQYTIYVNRYTGFMYYKNNKTGQILTSNPTNPISLTSESDRREIMSQLVIEYSEASNSAGAAPYNSVQWAALYGQISVSKIAGGLRVNYTLGDTTTRFLLPGYISAERYEEYILIPIINRFEARFAEACPDSAFNFFDNEDYVQYEYGCINTSKTTGLRKYLLDATKVYNRELDQDDPLAIELQNINSNINTLGVAYSLKNPLEYMGKESQASRLEQMYKSFPITETGVAIYVCKQDAAVSQKRNYSNIIKTYCSDYTMSMMYEDEEECGYVDNSEQKPAFRCALEYTFNEDGSLSVRLPANSVTFDESAYTLSAVTPLKYFGAGDVQNDGFIFFPDGSGAVVEFNDYYDVANGRNIPFNFDAKVYGADYCYSNITGANRQKVTMPVYGLVYNEKPSAQTAAIVNDDLVSNGYFAILEEGSSLANLWFQSGGSRHRYASVYASYNPYPSDKYDLSDTISVSSSSTYLMVADSKYSGSYVTRIVMLNDERVGNAVYGAGKYYNTTYSGMASYYRNYLKNDGTLSDLTLATNDLPLYVEVLGSMTIIDKFLTFPIEKAISLTTFEEISVMYKELSDSKKHIESLIAKYEADLDAEMAKSEKERDDITILNAEKMISVYEELLTKIQNITNVNFKLTGFANGGMYFTYPTKVRWERVCGGRSGFKKLISEAAGVSAQNGYNFSIYPEFDFMYINNTAAFDGISYKKTSAKMVDNRYASKQSYDSVRGEYEVLFAMLISSDVLDDLYTKFQKKYSKYDIKNISVSTLGSDLNSNFDEDNSINRDQSRENVMALLDRMTKTDGYDLMIDQGNIYAVKYASHILNVATDSSHSRYTSYTVPFVGMILHGSVNYSAKPLNYAGAVDYEILRSIESGAAPYYILCYANSSYAKEDEELNKYYGIDYNNWYNDILANYATLNGAIGSLQDYYIVDHETLIVERVLDENEKQVNHRNLENELLDMLDEQIAEKVADAYKALKADAAANMGKKVRVIVDIDKIAEQFATILGLDKQALVASDFYKEIQELVAAYTAEYPGAADEALNYDVKVSSIVYESKYNYFTDSISTDDDYVYTDYTLDDNKVVMVTYQKGDSVVRFVLNYNIYTVKVNLGNGQEFELGKNQFKCIDK